MDIINAVQKRLIELCNERKITVNRLANLSAVPPTTVKDILYGITENPTILTLKMLCDGLEITLFDFFNTPNFNHGKVLKVENENSGFIAENTMSAIKYRIVQLCKNKNIPVYKSEDITFVPASTIHNVLYNRSKNIKLMTIKKICDGFEITIPEFFNTYYFNSLEQEIK